MLGHLLIEGFGMKQILDFYYLLQKVDKNNHDCDSLLKDLGLFKFASGMMWFLLYLGLEEKYLLTAPNPEVGKVIKEEVFECGNMGYFDHRYIHKKTGYWSRGFSDVHMLLKISRIMPEEGLWRILWKIRNQFHKFPSYIMACYNKLKGNHSISISAILNVFI